MADNQLAIVERGRDPELQLIDDAGQQVSPQAWGGDLITACSEVALLLDASESGQDIYQATCNLQRAKLDNPALTPSAQILSAMQNENVPFFRFTMNQGIAHKKHFASLPLKADEQAAFAESVAESLRQQADIEAADTLSFDAFLAEYLKIPGHLSDGN